MGELTLKIWCYFNPLSISWPELLLKCQYDFLHIPECEILENKAMAGWNLRHKCDQFVLYGRQGYSTYNIFSYNFTLYSFFFFYCYLAMIVFNFNFMHIRSKLDLNLWQLSAQFLHKPIISNSWKRISIKLILLHLVISKEAISSKIITITPLFLLLHQNE